jgi:hypothetical protein
MGRFRKTVLGVTAANAFQSTRGGTEKQYSSNATVIEEPQEDPPTAAQQSLSSPYRQNSGYGQPWSPTHTQSFGTPVQPNNAFAYSQQYQQQAQYHDMTSYQNLPPQQNSPPHQGSPLHQSPPPQEVWQQQQPYSPQITQPPQTPPNPATYSGYHNDSFASPNPGNYEQPISSSHSQYSQQQYQMSPPPMDASPPAVPTPQRNSTTYDQTQIQFEPQVLQRSQTVPASTHWPRGPTDHDCSDHRNAYVFFRLMSHEENVRLMT